MHQEDAYGMANSVDPDHTAQEQSDLDHTAQEQSDLGLHCLPWPVCPKT